MRNIPKDLIELDAVGDLYTEAEEMRRMLNADVECRTLNVQPTFGLQRVQVHHLDLAAYTTTTNSNSSSNMSNQYQPVRLQCAMCNVQCAMCVPVNAMRMAKSRTVTMRSIGLEERARLPSNSHRYVTLPSASLTSLMAYFKIAPSTVPMNSRSPAPHVSESNQVQQVRCMCTHHMYREP
jgi:hypothetical protein